MYGTMVLGKTIARYTVAMRGNHVVGAWAITVRMYHLLFMLLTFLLLAVILANAH